MSVDATEAPWRRMGRFLPWCDYTTLLIAGGWLGLFMLWPDVPQTDSERIPRYPGTVFAHQAKLPAQAIYRRPDLIAFPSEMSFSAPRAGNSLPVDVGYTREGSSRVLARQRRVVSDDRPASAVALAAEAVRGVSDARVLLPYSPWGAASRKSASPVTVALSGGLSKAVPVWSEADQLKLFGVEHAWEVELSLSMSEDGEPVYVFLETRSGYDEIDRAVTMAVSRADTWQNGALGRGTVLISFSPTVGDGGTHED